MGRIHILTDQVANQIAAGEVVDRPASVVKELLENALDAGARRIRVEVDGGGRKLIRITDDGCGMGADDALLAFERHATSKIRSSDDLLSIATLGFRGEALPSIASIARLELETRSADEPAGTRVEISGGKIVRVEEAGLPQGTTITIRDLFFNTPARRKFLKAETTELAHVTALVTHYALAHPDKHFELLSPTHTLVQAAPVARAEERIFQIFGRATLDQLLPVAAERQFDHAGLPEPPPWRRDADYQPPQPGFLRLRGWTSKPELQKLNRNSIYVFVNSRLIRDRLVLHGVAEAYRNIIPPTSHPVLLLFLDMPPEEVDVNVHPAKTEVRFRQPTLVHDFVRDSLRTTLVKARPAANFLALLHGVGGHDALSPSGLPGVSPMPGEPSSDQAGTAGEGYRDSDPPPEVTGGGSSAEQAAAWTLSPPPVAPENARLPFAAAEPIGPMRWETHTPPLPRLAGSVPLTPVFPERSADALAAAAALAAATARAGTAQVPGEDPGGVHTSGNAVTGGDLRALASLVPLGQLRESFILATNDEGLWIIDQHVAHERILFEKVLREREVEGVQRQRLLMPMLVDLQPYQMVLFSKIADELERNGFEVEPFGPRTLAVKAAPAGLEGAELERMLSEVLEHYERETQTENLQAVRARIAASIACHAAIKVNMPLDGERMRWLLAELAQTSHPTSCPHGRPIALRYPWKDIERAFQRI